jgi:hypothetical protein
MRASYKNAIRWLVKEEVPATAVCLVADLWGKSQGEVVEDTEKYIRVRDNPKPPCKPRKKPTDSSQTEGWISVIQNSRKR